MKFIDGKRECGGRGVTRSFTRSPLSSHRQAWLVTVYKRLVSVVFNSISRNTVFHLTLSVVVANRLVCAAEEVAFTENLVG